MLKCRASTFVFTLVFLFSQIVAEKALSLKEVLEKVVANNYELKSISETIAANKILIDQAVRLPNPEAEIELENLGINGIGVAVTQTFELGGKRDARKAVAEKAVLQSEMEYKILQREVETEAIRRYLPLIAAQEQLATVNSMIKMVENTLMFIKNRVDAGVATEIDMLEAELEMDELIMERKTIQREYRIAKKKLIALMGEDPIQFDRISETFMAPVIIPPIETLENTLDQNPSMKMYAIEKEVIEAELKEAEADAITDLSVSLGYARNNEAGENAGIIAIGMDLPFFNKNQETIRSIKTGLKAVAYSKMNEKIGLKADLSELHSSMEGLVEQISTIKTLTLPKVERMYTLLYDYYARSIITVFDIIDTQKELLEIKTSIIELNTELTELAVDIYEITGTMIAVIK